MTKMFALTFGELLAREMDVYIEALNSMFRITLPLAQLVLLLFSVYLFLSLGSFGSFDTAVLSMGDEC